MAARTHHVEIKSLANLADGVVVRDPKGVRLRRLQFIKNFAILVGAFAEIGLRILSSANCQNRLR